MKTIFKVQHGCGWGPYTETFYETESGARAGFKEKIAKVKKEDRYVSRSMKIADPAKDPIFQKAIVAAGFKTGHETNNENGHEFWEEDEYVIIETVELKP